MLGDDGGDRCSNQDEGLQNAPVRIRVRRCGHRFEKIQKFSDPPIETCPTAAAPVHKLMSSPAFQFKGTGWYITDYAKKDKGTREDRRTRRTSKDDEGREGREGDDEESKEAREKRKIEGLEGHEHRKTRPPRRRPDDVVVHRRHRATSAAKDSSKAYVRCPASAGPGSTVCRPAPADRATRDSPRTCRRDPAAAARSRPPPSGTRACCRCRGARL